MVLILVLTASLLAGYAGVTNARVAAITYNLRADDSMMLQFRHRQRRGDGLARHARAGDGHARLGRDRIAIAGCLPTAEGCCDQGTKKPRTTPGLLSCFE
jgi:hypothetical protein